MRNGGLCLVGAAASIAACVSVPLEPSASAKFEYAGALDIGDGRGRFTGRVEPIRFAAIPSAADLDRLLDDIQADVIEWELSCDVDQAGRWSRCEIFVASLPGNVVRDALLLFSRRLTPIRAPGATGRPVALRQLGLRVSRTRERRDNAECFAGLLCHPAMLRSAGQVKFMRDPVAPAGADSFWMYRAWGATVSPSIDRRQAAATLDRSGENALEFAIVCNVSAPNARLDDCAIFGIQPDTPATRTAVLDLFVGRSAALSLEARGEPVDWFRGEFRLTRPGVQEVSGPPCITRWSCPPGAMTAPPPPPSNR